MMIGKKEIFAVKCDLNTDYSELLDGTISYWINNMQLGDDSEMIYLSDALMCFAWIDRDNWHRQYCDSVICGNWDKIFDELYKRIYQTDNVNEWNDTPAKFDISIDVSNKLGRYSVFYLEDSLYGHLIYKYFSDKYAEEFTVEKGYVDNVLHNTYKKLDELNKNVKID